MRRDPLVSGIALAVAGLLSACTAAHDASSTVPPSATSDAVPVHATALASSIATSTPTSTYVSTSMSTPVASTTLGAPTTLAASTTTSTAASSTTASSTTGASEAAVLQRQVIGHSVEGRAIIATERGTPGGVVVLVIGVIHGDEAAGARIVEELSRDDVPAGVDLWLIESINPDGVAHETRGNANGVDLNRNFPDGWAPLGQPGDGEYAGTGPASEPETKAVVEFISTIRPALGIWYHQDLFRIAPGSGRDGEFRAMYAEQTGLPLLSITGGTYTGVAATWQRRTITEGIAFIVELGPTLDDTQAGVHAAAVLGLARML